MRPAAARADLAAALATVKAHGGGVQVHPSPPDTWTAPALIIDAEDPWIVTTDAEMPWRSGMFRFVVQVIGRNGTPQAGPEGVEDLLGAVLDALYESVSEWSVETVGKPGSLTTTAKGTYPAVEVTVTAPLSLS